MIIVLLLHLPFLSFIKVLLTRRISFPPLLLGINMMLTVTRKLNRLCIFGISFVANLCILNHVICVNDELDEYLRNTDSDNLPYSTTTLFIRRDNYMEFS